MLNMNIIHNQPEWLYVSPIVLGDDVINDDDEISSSKYVTLFSSSTLISSHEEVSQLLASM